MSIQWSFIAGYLYVELAFIAIMLLPIFSPRRWNQFFHSRFCVMFQQNAVVYFYILNGVLSLFLMDAIREMRKYSHSDTTHVHLASAMKDNVKLFRAQRNFYITGFAIFLAFVIRRLVNMIIIQDELTKKADNIIKQAEATVKLAKDSVLVNSMQNEEMHQFEEVIRKLEVTQNLLNEERNNSKKLKRQLDLLKEIKLEESRMDERKGDE